MITIHKYTSVDAEIWDTFVEVSKNGTFMIKRGYLEYHSDRFIDFSLLFYDDRELIALLPASVVNNELSSHGGLTYGGLIVNSRMTVQLMLQLFDTLKDYLNQQGIKRLIYKRIPSIYYTYPADEDLYALFRFDAILVRRDISSSVYLPDKLSFTERRKRCVKKANKAGVVVRETHDYESYFSLLSFVLKKYHNAVPVHTAAELKLLSSRFPENIKLYAAYDGLSMIAGVVVYITPQVVHTQYIANSDEGRQCGALDAVMDFLINQHYKNKLYFDFGISTEMGGRLLNEGLITQKQEFGGRAVAYDFYEWKL